MKLLYFLGVDLSKNSIDFFCYQLKNHIQIKNSLAGFKELLTWLAVLQLDKDSVFLVMEHTGLYSYQLEKFLHRHHIKFAKISALEIKRSLGLIRGKNDKVDAERIARYAFEKKDRLVAERPTHPVIERLQMLHSTRERLMKYRTSLTCAIKQYRCALSSADPIITIQLTLIKQVSERVRVIDEQIRKCIAQADSSVKQNFSLLTTVIGVGEVIATATIVKTRNFTAFKNGRKFSCFCGCAPFDHSSGKSIRRKTRVSHLADKRMKTLLTMAARTAIQHDKELKAFYERRLAMGKTKNSTINIVRNKIILRMFAVINRQTPFIQQYSNAA
jgi:transposase